MSIVMGQQWARGRGSASKPKTRDTYSPDTFQGLRSLRAVPRSIFGGNAQLDERIACALSNAVAAVKFGRVSWAPEKS